MCSAPSVFQNKLAGTAWTDIDDAKVFKILDLEDLERTFSAYQRQQVMCGRGCAQASGTDAVIMKLLGVTCGLRTLLLPLFHSSALFARWTRSGLSSHLPAGAFALKW